MRKLFMLFFLGGCICVNGQVAVNTDGAAPDPSAMLDVKSTSKGILLPRMTLAQRSAIASPANGLMIYQTDNSPGFYYNAGSGVSPVWVVAGTGSGWGLSGNSGTSAGANFIGTTDNAPLTFKSNNQLVGKIDLSSFNTSFGYNSLIANTTGNFNTGMGNQTLLSNTAGMFNTAVGAIALFSNTAGSNNTAIGMMALSSNTTAVGNTATGFSALANNTTGENNTASGSESLGLNTTGDNNTASGWQSLNLNTTGNSNTAVGGSSLHNNTTGYENTAVGGNAMFFNTTGYENTAVGMHALFSNTEGVLNTAVGWQSLYTNTSGGWNTATGYWALSFNTIGYRNTASGVRALTDNTTGNNNTAYGVDALSWNTEGFQNTSFGAHSLVSNITGSYNTAVGYNTGPVYGYNYNTTCIGIDAKALGDNMVRLGNIFVTSIGGYADWTNISDSRFKENVKEDVPGLSFITQLRPVTYQLNRDKINEYTGVTESQNKLREKDPNLKFHTGDKYSQVTTGFIAQEVETAARKIGFDFSGVDAPKNENDYYGLRYAEFVVPLVKGMQEQQQMIIQLKQVNEELKQTVAQLINRIEKIENRK
ncbi:MAG: tail fiber domain-containing protein [Bacteroidetes bacterium]|nr:tail fiber domain-containing protein [Bacteroidota bacterium]